MHFDVPKVVRSPGCDHGHDEESRNGRDINIDILDDYIRTPKWFRGVSSIYQSTGGLSEPPGGIYGPYVAHPPMAGGRIGEGEEGVPPFPSLLLPLHSPS